MDEKKYCLALLSCSHSRRQVLRRPIVRKLRNWKSDRHALLEKTNGTYGYFGTVLAPQTTGAASTARAASGISAYAYSPPNSRRHKAHSKLR